MLSACKMEYPATPLSLGELPESVTVNPFPNGDPMSTRPSPHLSAQAIQGSIPFFMSSGVALAICSVAETGA